MYTRIIARIIALVTFICIAMTANAVPANKKHYRLLDENIDVVIVCHPKDKKTLDESIHGIRQNCDRVNRVIIVSPEKITEEAEWFDEKQFPFTREEIGLEVVRKNKEKARTFYLGKHRTPGWYYQQMLKLYSMFVIPGISSNVLVIDADTIFLNPVEFLNEKNGALFCYGPNKAAKPAYFQHASRLVPGYNRMNPNYYSVCHHMLFQKAILKDLFQIVEKHHGKPFWKAFCHCVDLKSNRGASEFEIYYSFALSHTDQVSLRELKWANSGSFSKKDDFKTKGFHFVSFHDYLSTRKRNPLAGLNQLFGPEK